MSERDTTSWGSARDVAAAAAPASSGEIAGASGKSTLAVTNRTNTALRELVGRAADFRREAFGEGRVALGADIMLRAALEEAKAALLELAHAELNRPCTSTSGQHHGTRSPVQFLAPELVYIPWAALDPEDPYVWP